MQAPGVERLVDDLFRRSAARTVARLTRALGASHLELAEEAVQDALIKALQTWPWKGVPERPEAWVFRVARNRALDRLRRRDRWEVEADPADLTRLADALGRLAPPPDRTGPGSPLEDDEAALLFLCCHPALGAEAAVPLTLRVVGGLGTREIAAAFLVTESTMAQRIVRAKRAMRSIEAPFEVPPPESLPERRDAVLKVLYLMFNEGYAATEGDLLVRRELCAEAVRLTGLLAAHPATQAPEVDALAALLLLQASRLPARVDGAGELLVLSEQDRRAWDPELRARGLAHLERAARGERVTPYHLEAGIAAVHAVAPSFDETDWAALVAQYDHLARVVPSPIVQLNRAVAVGMRDGGAAGLRALDGLADDGARLGYRLPAVRAWLCARAGREAEAESAYREAAGLAESEPVRRHLLRRAGSVRGPASSGRAG